MKRFISADPRFDGCDFIVPLAEDRVEPRLLQLTDMQVINAEQRRTPDRLRDDEIKAWQPEAFDGMCGNHIRSLVAQTRPDLIFITGDIVYGSFDDDGSTLDWFCRLMASFRIPWAPVFGNHDNETAKGVTWQCERLENSEYCLFKRGNVTGNGNYTVGITVGDKLKFVLYMLDSNGCLKPAGLYADQFEFVRSRASNIRTAYGQTVPSLLAYHIPTEEFVTAEKVKGYLRDDRIFYTIGVDVPAKDGDFGSKHENVRVPQSADASPDLFALAEECGLVAVCVGHWHNVNTCIIYRGIRFVYGLKTGQYDYHMPGQVGGTLLRVTDGLPEVSHVPSLVPYAPYPKDAPMFRGMFAE